MTTTDTPTPSPLLQRPGAVPASGNDAAVAWHYGNPTKEGRALEEGRALVDLSHFGVVTVTGPDRLSWLDTLSSQRLNELPAGASSELLLLDPNGHIEYAAGVVDDGETAWLTTDVGLGGGLAAFLESMKFMLRVEITERTDLAVLGAAHGSHTLVDSEAVWQDPWPELDANSTSYSETLEHPGHDLNRAFVIVNQDQLASVRNDQLAGIWAWEAMRVAAWRPRQTTEVDERVIPHELDWLRTSVHLSKGCYRGQETIARVINMGKPPRRLTFLHLDGSLDQLPEPGADIIAGERRVGHITTVARHHELGPIALALIKRAADPDADLRVELGEDQEPLAASQELIVNVAGVTDARPATRPGAGLRRNPELRRPKS